jgi:hypothetical protein
MFRYWFALFAIVARRPVIAHRHITCLQQTRHHGQGANRAATAKNPSHDAGLTPCGMRGIEAFRMRPPSTSIVPVYLAVAPPDIAAVKFIFESYEEVGVVRTLDRHAALIVILVVPDFLAVAEAIVAELERDYAVRRVPMPPEAASDWLLGGEGDE